MLRAFSCGGNISKRKGVVVRSMRLVRPAKGGINWSAVSCLRLGTWG